MSKSAVLPVRKPTQRYGPGKNRDFKLPSARQAGESAVARMVKPSEDSICPERICGEEDEGKTKTIPFCLLKKNAALAGG